MSSVLLNAEKSFRLFNPMTPDSVKSKTDKFYKITNWVKMKNKEPPKESTAQQLSNEWSNLVESVHRIKR